MKMLSIHLTDLCNSSCNFCVVASPLYTKDSVDYAGVVQFLRSNANQGYAAVNLHGGEPTIHPKFIETLELIRDLGYPEVHLQTNGIKLADNRFANRLIALRVGKFIVSLHGDQAAIQDSQTCTPGGLARTIEGIRNVKTCGAHVRTNTVITLQNLERLPAISNLACDLGVDHVNFSNLHPVGSALYARVRIMATFKEMRERLYESIDLIAARGRIVTLEGFPYCVVTERLSHQLNNDWREIRMLMRGKIINSYDNFMSDVMRVFGGACENCTLRAKCGGVYPQYVDYHGWEEFSPLRSELALA